jgi:hypothetical protein
MSRDKVTLIKEMMKNDVRKGTRMFDDLEGRSPPIARLIGTYKNHDFLFYTNYINFHQDIEAHIIAVNRKTGLTSIHVAGKIKKHTKGNSYTLYVDSLSGRPGSPLKAADFYAYLVNTHNWILVSGESQSVGAQKVWKRLAKKTFMYAADIDPDSSRTIGYKNISPKDDADEHELYNDKERYKWDSDYSRDLDGPKASAEYTRLVAIKPDPRRKSRYTGRVVKSRKKVNEDAPTNNVGGGNIAGLGIGPKGEPGVTKKRQRSYRKRNFAGAAVFEVTSNLFYEIKLSKRKGKHWRTYLNEDDSYQEIREYAAQNRKGAIIIQNEVTGEMVYCRYP